MLPTILISVMGVEIRRSTKLTPGYTAKLTVFIEQEMSVQLSQGPKNKYREKAHKIRT